MNGINPSDSTTLSLDGDEEKPMKTVMLGIDAGDLAFIQQHGEQLPVLKKWIANAGVTVLDSTSKLLPGSVWPTFYTGTNPGEHGIYHHLQWDPGAMHIRRVSADWLYSEPFWYELAQNGLGVTVVDVPMMFPSRLESGFEVVNWGSHDQLGSFHCNKPDLERAIKRRFGRHPMGPEIPVNKSASQLETIHRNLVAGVKRKGELLRYLLTNTEWDFFLGVFGECHRGGHILWPESNSDSVVPEHALLDVYQAVDTALGDILNVIDNQNTRILLFSLHGMESNKSQEHFIAPVMKRINALYSRNVTQESEWAATQHSLIFELRNQLPARLQNAIAKAVPVWVRDWVVSKATSSGYDWKHTPGFALLADYNGYLRFNLQGREAVGCLQPDDNAYQVYKDYLEKNFRDLRISDGAQPLVKELTATEDIYPGVRSSLLPDLIVTWPDNSPVNCIESETFGQITTQLDTGRSGNHRHEGFVSVLEPGGDNNLWHSLRCISDLAPTMLSVLLSPKFSNS